MMEDEDYALPELVKCKSCGVRTLPRVAAAEWIGGRCDLCTEEGLRQVLETGTAPDTPLWRAAERLQFKQRLERK
jgi:ribosomal protein L37AE/L43A